MIKDINVLKNKKLPKNVVGYDYEATDNLIDEIVNEYNLLKEENELNKKMVSELQSFKKKYLDLEEYVSKVEAWISDIRAVVDKKDTFNLFDDLPKRNK
ncbi:DivIVA domain-containing protein [Ureaplasma canigenitalium]|uniref:DivIVA domain-containing protein n=1 Tax=Ureaplasma canigenitalium TaxID=42092 RepID=UPI0004E1719F|nr:DivIVA domain-containing protein [Ureaplasma canigenitalium]